MQNKFQTTDNDKTDNDKIVIIEPTEIQILLFFLLPAIPTGLIMNFISKDFNFSTMITLSILLYYAFFMCITTIIIDLNH